MPKTSSRREERLSVRLTKEQRDIIARAALFETGGDLSRFVAAAATEAARKTIREHDVSQVTDEMRGRFYSLLLNPPKPTADLVALMREPVPSGYELED